MSWNLLNFSREPEERSDALTAETANTSVAPEGPTATGLSEAPSAGVETGGTPREKLVAALQDPEMAVWLKELAAAGTTVEQLVKNLQSPEIPVTSVQATVETPTPTGMENSIMPAAPVENLAPAEDNTTTPVTRPEVPTGAFGSSATPDATAGAMPAESATQSGGLAANGITEIAQPAGGMPDITGTAAQVDMPIAGAAYDAAVPAVTEIGAPVETSVSTTVTQPEVVTTSSAEGQVMRGYGEVAAAKEAPTTEVTTTVVTPTPPTGEGELTFAPAVPSSTPETQAVPSKDTVTILTPTAETDTTMDGINQTVPAVAPVNVAIEETPLPVETVVQPIATPGTVQTEVAAGYAAPAPEQQIPQVAQINYSPPQVSGVLPESGTVEFA